MRNHNDLVETCAPICDYNSRDSNYLLPPAYVVRREGNVLTRVCLSVCLSTGGISQLTQPGGGVSPAGGGSVQQGGRGGQSSQGGGVSPAGGGGQSAGGSGGGGQPDNRMSTHYTAGRYASCVHAGGLSC